MAQCKLCDKKGFFLQVDTNGLCSDCVAMHLPVIVRSCEIIVESGKIIDKTKNASTRLSRCRLAIEHSERLNEYDRKGIPTLSVPPTDLIYEFQTIADQTLNDEVLDAKYQAEQTFQDATTDAGKLGGFKKAINRLDKLMQETSNVTKLELAIDELRTAKDSAAIILKIRKAELLFAQSKKSRAVDQLIEALHLLRHDRTDDRRQA